MRFLFALTAVPAFAALMPMPASVTPGNGKLAIDSSFAIETRGYSDARLQRAMARLVSRIARQTGIEIRGGKTALWIECAGDGDDESYRLDVGADGAVIHSATVIGAMHGMETFAQWIDGTEARAVHIEDHPRFRWRGLMFDAARHWMPVDVVERNLDGMAAVKLNVFHWHLSDDQGFRVESKRFPKLQALGSDGHYYTQSEIRAVVEYARDRGIRVVPEFDIPGHTTSWFAGYPEFASAPGPFQIERAWGIFQPLIDPSREETYRFLDGFIGEMAALFPDPYFHIGGDEVEPTEWNQSAAIQAWAASNGLRDAHAIQGYFNRKVEKILLKYGKTMIGWDEVFDPALDSKTVIQSWRGQASLADAARAGYRGVLSFGYYLDHLKPASFHYGIDPLSGAAAQLNGEQQARILGGEACMWNEYADAETVDSRIWPRAAAISERLWSLASVTDVDSMYQRIEIVSRNLEWVGLKHRSNEQPMLDRLAGDRDPAALRVLADASEALGIDGRRNAQKYTSLVSLNRFVDAARPESELVRHMELDARRVVANPESPRETAELRATLGLWAQIDAQPGELAALSKNLSILGSMGLRALEYLKTPQSAPQDWIAQQRAALAEIEKTSAEVILAATRPVRILIEGVAKQVIETKDVR
jgi:hexosaminidase